MADGCREVLDDLERYLDGECSDELAGGIADHLSDCPPCLSRSDFERALRDPVARPCRDTAPADLVAKVRAPLP